MLKTHYDLDSIRARLSIREVLERSGVTIINARAVCPIPGPCTGKRGASFAIYSDGTRYFCHRCGATGDVFALLQRCEGLSAAASFRRAASLAGIAARKIPASTSRVTRNPQTERRRILGESFRTTAAIRDCLRDIADDKRQSLDLRASALSGVVFCNRKLDFLLSGDDSAIDGFVASLQVSR